MRSLETFQVRLGLSDGDWLVSGSRAPAVLILVWRALGASVLKRHQTNCDDKPTRETAQRANHLQRYNTRY